MFGLKAKYDAEGNRIAKGDVKYFWDHRNRLVKVVSPSETVEYTYDYQNRLVSRKTEKGKEYFVHDGWQIALILNGNGSVKERLLWGTHQDELLAQGEKFTLNDHLNTVRDVINADGKVIAHYDYNAFGKQLNASSDTLQFAYTGKLTDSATGLQWNINRWYDANAGRWISEDPIGFKGKDSNIYRYIHNNVVNLLDTFGMRELIIRIPVYYQSSILLNTHTSGYYEVTIPYNVSCTDEGKIKNTSIGTLRGNLLNELDYSLFPLGHTVFSGTRFIFESNIDVSSIDKSCPKGYYGERKVIPIQIRVYSEDFYTTPIGIDTYVFPKILIGRETVELTIGCCIKCEESDTFSDSDYDCYECDSGTCNGKYHLQVPYGNPIPRPWECTKVPCN